LTKLGGGSHHEHIIEVMKTNRCYLETLEKRALLYKTLFWESRLHAFQLLLSRSVCEDVGQS